MPPPERDRILPDVPVLEHLLTASSTKPPSEERPYPDHWERVAELRVFRAPHAAWDRLIAWRNDMRKRGWRLLRVTSDNQELVAVFGKTKADLEAKGR